MAASAPLPVDLGELVERIPAVVYIADFDERATLRYVSPQIETLLGLPAEAFIADQGLWHRHVHPDDLERLVAEERRTLVARSAFDFEFRMVHADGRVMWVWERDTVVRGRDGRLYSQGVLVDITAQRRAEDELRAERDRAQLYLDLAGTVIVVVGPDDRIALLNRTGHEILGHPDGALVGHDFFEACIPERDRDRLRRGYHENLAADRINASIEQEVRTATGEERTLRWESSALRDDAGRPVGILSAGLDITERRAAEAQIAFLAYHDPLTRLPNRELLAEHLELAMARAERTGDALALLYIDLDDFKLVNDTLGHAAGDEVLRAVAAGLEARTRDADLLVRQGGDEFLLLLADLDPEEAQLAAETAAAGVLSALADPFTVGGTEFDVNASVGISLFPRDAGDAESLLKHADTAMYEAKAAGHNQLRVFHDDSTPSVARLSLGTRLRQAITRDELTLYWQPIDDLRTGRIAGIEALVRWPDGDGGLILPDAFIPYAEDSGLIEPLGEWVAQAFTQQRLLWREQGLAPWAGFNLSPRELRQPELVERLLATLTTGGLDLEHVTIELTESAVLREDARVRGLLRSLDDAGVTVLLDDFGVAYSSLARLREVPARWIKIDRSFLEGVPQDRDRLRIFDAVLGLVTALGMETIVEGIETDAHLALLRERDVVHGQGYALGRPAPAEELAGRLRESPVSWISPSSPTTSGASSPASSRTGAAGRS